MYIYVQTRFCACMYVIGVDNYNVCVSFTCIVSTTATLILYFAVVVYGVFVPLGCTVLTVCWFYIHPLICATFISILNLCNGSSGDKCWKEVIWIKVYSQLFFQETADY